MVKGDRLNKDQCPRNDLELEKIKSVSYASVVGSFMYAQVCTRPDIAFAISFLERYQSIWEWSIGRVIKTSSIFVKD